MGKIISFRTHLTGEITDILRDEGLECARTNESIATGVAALVSYQEEGVPLWPELYICENISLIAAIVQSVIPIKVGASQTGPRTIKKALKECAPLARDGWAIYLERVGGELNYGVFRPSSLPGSINAFDAISDKDSTLGTVVKLQKITRDSVHLIGARGSDCRFVFSEGRTQPSDNGNPIGRLALQISAGIDLGLEIDFSGYIENLLRKLMIDSHGCLVAVTAAGLGDCRGLFGDVVLFDDPIDFSQYIREYSTNEEALAYSRLQGAEALLKGMVESDGVVVFQEGGKLIGYRGFVQNDTKAGDEVHVGGARSRAFNAMKSLPADQVKGVYFQSQDGNSEYVELENGE